MQEGQRWKLRKRRKIRRNTEESVSNFISGKFILIPQSLEGRVHSFCFLLLFTTCSAVEVPWQLVKPKAILEKQLLLGEIFGNMSEKQFMLSAWDKSPPVDESALDNIYSSTARCRSPSFCSPLVPAFRIIVWSKGNYKSQTWSHSAALSDHWFVCFSVMDSWIGDALFYLFLCFFT